MKRKITVSLFDLMFERVAKAKHAEICKTDTYYPEKYNTLSKPGEIAYWKSRSTTMMSLFRRICDVSQLYSGCMYNITACSEIIGINVEIEFDTDNTVDISNSMITIGRFKGSRSSVLNSVRKPEDIGSSLLDLIEDMVGSISNGSYADYCWCCSKDVYMSRDQIVISGVCSEDTIILHLDDSLWFTDRKA